jgi:hypothetical protein
MSGIVVIISLIPELAGEDLIETERIMYPPYLSKYKIGWEYLVHYHDNKCHI